MRLANSAVQSTVYSYEYKNFLMNFKKICSELRDSLYSVISYQKILKLRNCTVYPEIRYKEVRYKQGLLYHSQVLLSFKSQIVQKTKQVALGCN